MTGSLTFILGGARSGKSTYAEQRARERGGRTLYVATAEAFDDEMRARIERHRAGRPPDWTTLEIPLGIGAALSTAFTTARYETVVVDCVTLLASNALLALPEDAPDDSAIDAVVAEVDGLLNAIAATDADWFVVSNEVGLGVVPPTRLGRVYRDALGRANQRIALAADEVILLVAGLPWKLKAEPAWRVIMASYLHK